MKPKPFLLIALLLLTSTPAIAEIQVFFSPEQGEDIRTLEDKKLDEVLSVLECS